MDQSQAAILGAAIAASVTIITFIVSKEAKVSEFRQAWIDALRADISETISSLSALVQLFEDVPGDNEAYQRTWLTAKTSIARTRLRLNPDEPQHREFASLLDEIEQTVRDTLMDGISKGQFSEFEKAVVRRAQPLLKFEWERVKRGEPAFRMATGFVKFAFLFLLIFTLIEFLGH